MKTRLELLVLGNAIIFAVTLAPPLALAVTWDGGVSGTGTDWTVGANWVGDVVPTSVQNADISKNLANVTLNGFTGTAYTGLGVASTVNNTTSTLTISNSALTNGSGFNIGSGAGFSGGVGTLIFVSSTATNFGETSNNNWMSRGGGGSATWSLDASTVTTKSGFIVTLNSTSTITAKNNSTLDLSSNGQITMSGGNANFNVDATSKFILGNNFATISGTGGRIYDMPLGNWANRLTSTGKIYSFKGIAGISGNTVVNIDATIDDSADTYKRKADATLDWNNGTIDIGSASTLNVKGVTINNFGGSSNNSWMSQNGGTSTFIVDGSTIVGTSTLSFGLNRNGSSGSNSTINVRNGSHLNFGNRGQITTGGGSNATFAINVDGTSKITLGNATSGGTLGLNGVAAGGGTLVLNLPLGNWANQPTGTGKIYAYRGINQIAATAGTKVTVNLDSTIDDSADTYKKRSDTALDWHSSSLQIGNGSTSSVGVLNITGSIGSPMSITNMADVQVGRGGGSGTLSITNGSLNVASSNLTLAFDTNTSKGKVILSNGTINMSTGYVNRASGALGSATGGAETRGTGTISMSANTFTNNGRVVADGGTLAITGTGAVTSNIESAANLAGTFGPAGWFAVNSGKLTLPGLTSIGTGKTWGEASADATPELVNSVQLLSVTGASGTLNGSVLAPTNSSVPDGIYKPVSLFEFTGLTTTSATMKVRFDDALASTNSTPESSLKLFRYSGGTWVNITDTALNSGGFTAGIDPTSNYIQSVAFAGLGSFARSQAATPLSAFWTGDQGSVWNTDIITNTNWSTSAAGGPDTEAPPGTVSDVYFAATGASNLSTTLGANFSVNSITFSNGSPVSIGGAHTLTIGTGGLTVQTGSADPIISSNIALGDGQTWTVTDAVSELTVSGDISGGAANSLTKSGNGTLILGGTNSYAGATNVDAGTLLVNGSTHASSAVTVAAGATLGGTGIIGGNTVIHGIHSPGNSPGIQTFAGNLTYEADPDDPIVQWELIDNTVTNLPNPNALFDTIVVGGTLDFADPTALDLIFDAAGSLVDWTDSFWATSHLGTNGWLLYDVAGATTNFANLSITPEDWLDGNTLSFNTARPGSSFSLIQDGNDIYLNYNFAVSAVPEPSTYALALLGLAWFGLVAWRRRGSIANC